MGIGLCWEQKETQESVLSRGNYNHVWSVRARSSCYVEKGYNPQRHGLWFVHLWNYYRGPPTERKLELLNPWLLMNSCTIVIHSHNLQSGWKRLTLTKLCMSPLSAMYLAHFWGLSLERKKNIISLWLMSHNPLFLPLIISIRCFTNSGDRSRTYSTFPMTKGISSPNCFRTQLRLWGDGKQERRSLFAKPAVLTQYQLHRLRRFGQAKEQRLFIFKTSLPAPGKAAWNHLSEMCSYWWWPEL